MLPQLARSVTKLYIAAGPAMKLYSYGENTRVLCKPLGACIIYIL